MTNIVFKTTNKTESPSRMVLAATFEGGKTYNYNLPNDQVNNLVKGTKYDRIMFDGAYGFSPVSLKQDETATKVSRSLVMEGAINVGDPRQFRKEFGLETVTGPLAELEDEYGAVFLGPASERKIFFEKADAFIPNDRKNIDIDLDKLQDINPIFGTDKINPTRKDYKGVEVTFSNGSTKKYAYLPETAPLLTMAKELPNTTYFDSGLDLDKNLHETHRDEPRTDFTPSRPLTPVRIKALPNVPTNARELVFRGAANVENPNEARQAMGYAPMRGTIRLQEEEYYAFYIGKDWENKHQLTAREDFLERTKFIYKGLKQVTEASETLDEPRTESFSVNPDDMDDVQIEENGNSKYTLLLDDYKEVPDKCHFYNQETRVYRIQAKKNFGDVKAGDLGGYVSDLKSIGQSGKAWVYDDAIVSGTARITGDAQVKGDSHISSMVRVRGDMVIENETLSTNTRQYRYIETPEDLIEPKFEEKVIIEQPIENDRNTLDDFIDNPHRTYWEHLSTPEREELSKRVYERELKDAPFGRKEKLLYKSAYDDLTPSERREIAEIVDRKRYNALDDDAQFEEDWAQVVEDLKKMTRDERAIIRHIDPENEMVDFINGVKECEQLILEDKLKKLEDAQQQ